MRADLPAPLQPNSTLAVLLASKEVVEIPKCTPSFDRWEGETPAFTLGGKPFVEMNGEPLFAELAILRLLQADGWNGVCVQEFGGWRFYTSLPKDAKFTGSTATIPDDKSEVLNIIASAAGRKGGCPDVFAWKDDHMLFCEAKRLKRDRVQSSQERWIDAALRSGIPLNSLLIAEWRFK